MPRPLPNVVCLRATAAAPSPAVFVAAWLIEELGGLATVSVSLAETTVVLDIDPATALPAACAVIRDLLHDRRFDGWSLVSPMPTSHRSA